MARSIISKYKITLCLPNQQQQECCGDISNEPCFNPDIFSSQFRECIQVLGMVRYSSTKTDQKLRGTKQKSGS